MTDHQWDGMIEMFILLLKSKLEPGKVKDEIIEELQRLQKKSND